VASSIHGIFILTGAHSTDTKGTFHRKSYASFIPEVCLEKNFLSLSPQDS